MSIVRSGLGSIGRLSPLARAEKFRTNSAAPNPSKTAWFIEKPMAKPPHLNVVTYESVKREAGMDVCMHINKELMTFL